MKYIGIGIMWLGYAGAVAAVAFSPNSSPNAIGVAAFFGALFVAIASARVAKGSKG